MKLFYRGRHRGEYQPSEHWWHTKCGLYGCTIKLNCTIHGLRFEEMTVFNPGVVQ